MIRIRKVFFGCDGGVRVMGDKGERSVLGVMVGSIVCK